MTTQSNRELHIASYTHIDVRRTTALGKSKRTWGRLESNQLPNWTSLRLFHLLTQRYDMPERDAWELKELMDEKSLTVENLTVMVDEEIEELVGMGFFTQEMNDFVSLAIIDYIIGRRETKTLKALRKKLKK